MSVKKPDDTSTRVIYVGHHRYRQLCRQAREISILADTSVRPSQFLQFMIDGFSEQTRAAMLMHLRNEAPDK